MNKPLKYSLIALGGLVGLVLLFLFMVGVAGTIRQEEMKSRTVKQVSPEQRRADSINDIQREAQRAQEDAEEEKAKVTKKLFSAWDGSCRSLVKLVKANMNDPSSFEHVETTFTYYPDKIFVIMRYRGANAFGAKVLNYVKVDIDHQGNVIQVYEN